MIRILVDSASDISYTNSENILVVPLSVNIGGKSYIDGVELGHDQFYEMLVSSPDFPKTSQPSPQSFVDAYNQLQPEDELICIMLSSGVSGTYQSACLAKSIVDNDNIYVIDSLTGAYGVKILVDEAKKMIEQGKTASEIVEKLEEMKHHICVYLSVDTLDYLYKGGRLDKKAALIGNIAKLKPLITVTREGTIGVVSKAIGLNRTIQAMIDVMNEIEVDTNYPLYTIQTVGEKNITKLEQKLADANLKVECRELLGPVVGSHVGPETFGVIFFGKNLDKIPM